MTARQPFGLVPAILTGLGLRPTQAAEQPAPAPQEGTGHETSDVNVRNTALVMAGLGGTALLAVGLMIWLMSLVAGVQRRDLPPFTAQQTARIRPPPPNLQADPYADIARHDAATAQALDGYAYLDADRTRARIPIDRAMALTVGRSLDP
ncbi:hypothetical protein [Methylobacterium sp. A54F]